MNGLPPSRRPLLMGLAAGTTLGVSDWAMSGLGRTPMPLILASVVGGALGGLLAGVVGSACRRPRLALAMLLGGGVALEGLSAASKHLAGMNQGLGATLALALALVSVIVLSRDSAERGRLEDVGVVIALPAGTWLGGTLSRDPWMLVVSCVAPLLWVAVVRAGRASRGVSMGAWGLLLLAVAGAQLTPRTLDRRAPPASARTASDGPCIVLLVIDTLRSDALDPDGSLAEFGRNGVVFQRCESVAPWTLPAMSSMFTGLYPSQHGAVTAVTPLAEELTTLAELLQEQGYATAAFTGGAFVGRAHNLDQGFEVFDSTHERRFAPFGTRVPLAWRLAKNRFFPVHWLVQAVDESVGLAGVAAAARAWAGQEEARPRFLFLHTYQVHDYYIYDPDLDDEVLAKLPEASPEFEGRLSVRPNELARAKQSDLDHFHALYQGRIRAVERLFPEIRAELEPFLGEDAIWVVTADHGEGFDASRKRVHHGGRLHEDLLHVPLLIQAPGRLEPGQVVESTVRTIDILPTLLDLARLPIPDNLAGESLLPALAGERPFPHSAFAEESAHGYSLLSLQRNGWKWIRAPGHVELYRLDRDPLESDPLPLAERPVELGDELLDFPTRYPARTPAVIQRLDPSTLEQLQDLGYVR